MKAYNIIFLEPGAEKTVKVPGSPYTETNIPAPDRSPDGWAGRFGPNIPWENWPRNPNNKTPMFHVLTTKVPKEYRTAGDKYVALTIFEGGDDNRKPAHKFGILPTPFKKDYYASKPHPRAINFKYDYNDRVYQIIWLSEEEFNAGPKPIPFDLRNQTELKKQTDYVDTAWQINEWETIHDVVPAWLIDRDDPNAGKIPNEYDLHGYVNYNNDEYEDFQKEQDDFTHFGGTTFAPQGIMEELTETYLEIFGYSGVNLGDSGNVQLDLKNYNMYWACY